MQAILARPGQDEAELDRRLGAAGRAYALEHPGYVATVLWRNTARLWTLGGADQRWLTRLSHTETGVPARLDGLLSASAVLALVLAVAGAFALVRRRRGSRRAPRWPWAIPVLLWLGTVAISGAPRYRTVLDPWVLLLAAVAVSSWQARRSARRTGVRPAG